MDALRAKIRDVPDFPKKGIVFKDLTPVISDPVLFRKIINHLAERWNNRGISKVVGIESRGFLFAAPLAYLINAGVTIVRKPGKLPYQTHQESYALEYGTNSVELHVDAIAKGERILVVDDLLATGGTAEAAGKLVVRQGGDVIGYSFVIELGFLNGGRRLGLDKVHSLLCYDTP